jgi:short-subunit dehydrogenase
MTKKQTVIIIGATGGIGSVIARRFAEAGMRVVLSARTKEKLMELKASLGTDDAFIIPADASKIEDVENLFKTVQTDFGGMSAVVIAAGTWKQLSINADTEDALELAEKHFHALFLPSFIVGFVAQKFLRIQGHGLIANVSSHAALRPELDGNLTYGPMKSASRHFMLALRHELEGTGVRVSDIAPAIVNTPDAAGLLDTEEKRSKAVQPEAIADWIIEHLEDPSIPASKLFDSEIKL